jgi:hypothetical protein
MIDKTLMIEEIAEVAQEVNHNIHFTKVAKFRDFR